MKRVREAGQGVRSWLLPAIRRILFQIRLEEMARVMLTGSLIDRMLLAYEIKTDASYSTTEIHGGDFGQVVKHVHLVNFLPLHRN